MLLTKLRIKKGAKTYIYRSKIHYYYKRHFREAKTKNEWHTGFQLYFEPLISILVSFLYCKM